MTPAQPRRTPPIARAMLALLLLTAACRNDLDDLFCDPKCDEVNADTDSEGESADGADDSADAAMQSPSQSNGAPQPDSGSQPDEEAPFLSVWPDEEVVEDCEACVKDACAFEREQCLLDDACTELLRAGEGCDDPACLEELRGQGGGINPSTSPFLFDHALCTLEQCRAECQLGFNWGCSGDFFWPSAKARSIEVQASFATGRWSLGNSGNARIVLGGTTVRACSIDANCGQDAVLDAANTAQLTLPTAGVGSTFRGYFELQADDVGVIPIRYHYYPWPLAYGGPLDIGLVPDHVTVSWGWLPSPELAALWVFVTDCTNGPAARTRIVLPDHPEAAVHHATSDWLSVPADESPFGMAFVPELDVDADGELVRVQAFLPDSSEPIAWRQIRVVPGWLTYVLLFPQSATGE